MSSLTLERRETTKGDSAEITGPDVQHCLAHVCLATTELATSEIVVISQENRDYKTTA